MATATATATVTVAAAAAKLVNGSRVGARFPVSSSVPSIYSFYCGRKPVPLVGKYSHSHNHSHRRSIYSSFCTSADVNAATSPTASAKEPDGDENAQKSVDSVKDAGNMLDIRVGRIIKAWMHEEADSLYVEEVDVGEAEPRIICSGLVKYIPIDFLQDRNVVVLANLKPRNMRGVKSNGMLMAASDASHENVELLEPPEGSIPGERIWFGSEDDKLNQPSPATPNQIQKKKIWESVQPHLKTNDSCTAMLGEHLMRTSTGVVVCRSLKNANIS